MPQTLSSTPPSNSQEHVKTAHFVTIETWLSDSGMSRTDTYRKLGAGLLRAKKVGRRTLIDYPHALAWLRSMPDAVITTR